MHRMNWIYWLGWVFFRTLFRFYFRWRVYHRAGRCRAAWCWPRITPVIWTAAGGRREAAHRLPGGKRCSAFRLWAGCYGAGVSFLDRDGGSAAGLRVILEQLHAGHAIIYFPKARAPITANCNPRVRAGLIVIKSDQPVVPVRVFGTYAAYGRHCAKPRPRRMAVKYGKPLDFALRSEANGFQGRLKEIYQQVADEIMAAITRWERGQD